MAKKTALPKVESPKGCAIDAMKARMGNMRSRDGLGSMTEMMRGSPNMPGTQEPDETPGN